MRVVVGVDGSTSSLAALRWAAAAARCRGWPLEAVHAVPPSRAGAGSRGREAVLDRVTDQDAEVLAKVLQDEAAAVAGLELRPRAVRGRAPERELQDAADGAGLLVVGRGAQGLRGLLGSVAGHLAGQASCPVVVVPARWAGSLERIVAGVDGSAAASGALEWAAAEAVLRGAALELVHAYLPYRSGRPFGAEFMEVASPHAQQRLRRLAEEVLGEALSTPAAQTAGARGRVLTGPAAGALVEAARAADLLAVGRHGVAGGLRRLPGPVCRGVLHRAQVPVAVVPPAAPAAR